MIGYLFYLVYVSFVNVFLCFLACQVLLDLPLSCLISYVVFVFRLFSGFSLCVLCVSGGSNVLLMLCVFVFCDLWICVVFVCVLCLLIDF